MSKRGLCCRPVSIYLSVCLFVRSFVRPSALWAGHDHAQAVSAQVVVEAVGDRASRFGANNAGWPRRYGRAHPLDRNAAAEGL